MSWLGKSQGIFKLHDSDNYCGSYLAVDDAAEILAVSTKDLLFLPIHKLDNSFLVSELDLHRAWGAGKIPTPHPLRVGNA
jgi:hypothetical protein